MKPGTTVQKHIFTALAMIAFAILMNGCDPAYATVISAVAEGLGV